jgi:sensor histidine kinase YesM
MHINFMAYLDEIFNNMRSDQTTVAQEINLLELYLDIFRIRMGRRLSYDIQSEPYLDKITFPSLLIQPIVENAIKHGLEPKVAGGSIKISVQIKGKQLKWKIADTGVGISNESSLGIGLGNVMDRMDILYGSDAELTIEENEPSGTKVTIEVPYA